MADHFAVLPKAHADSPATLPSIHWFSMRRAASVWKFVWKPVIDLNGS